MNCIVHSVAQGLWWAGYSWWAFISGDYLGIGIVN